MGELGFGGGRRATRYPRVRTTTNPTDQSNHVLFAVEWIVGDDGELASTIAEPGTGRITTRIGSEDES
jgi:hypothetical protein